MDTLFPLPPIFPPGFFYLPDFINEAEEAALVQAVSAIELQPLIFRGFTARRSVMSFGYDYHFDSRTVSKGRDIPAGFTFLADKVAAYMNISAGRFAELLVSEYPAGSVINWHRDAPVFDMVVGISLLSDCTFRLRPYGVAPRGHKHVLSLTVGRRSLYVLGGEARSQWEHSIAAVKEKRLSLTLRTLKEAG